MNPELRLYTFSISHFSEKIRWALDAAEIPYREIRWTPVFHAPLARRKSRKRTTVPIIETDTEVIQDSTAILHWLSRTRAPFPLLPEDPEPRREVLEIEKRFDEVGKHVIRYAYGTALEHPDAVQRMWLLDAKPLERVFLPLLFPVIKPLFRKRFRITPDAVALSRQVIDDGIAWLDGRVADGRRFLIGERLTAADLTAAALLAPLACPSEHPVYGQTEYREVIAPAVSAWSARPAFEWVRMLYAKERGGGRGRTADRAPGAHRIANGVS